MLSGFLITARYNSRLQFSWSWAKRYMQNRVARIYPLYFLLTVLSFAIFQWNASYDVSGLWQKASEYPTDKALMVGLNLTFLRGFFDYFKFSGIAPGWTLTVEECFYLSAPLLLYGLHRSRKLLGLYPFLLIGIGYLLVAAGSGLAAKGIRTFGLFDTPLFMLSVTFFGRCVEFIAGMGLALVFQRGASREDKFPWYTVLGLTWMGFCVLAMMRVQLVTPLPAVPITELPQGAGHYQIVLLRNFLLPVGIVALFFGLIREQSWLRSLLATGWAGLLGKSSYAFYLVHFGILSVFLQGHVTQNVLLQFVLSVAVSIALYQFIEHPLQVRLASKK